ncbi:hypothetical protein TNCV_3908661 [Trichonephila clavipes]|nr:hypothetical protein TNCV_3908661 [Trichonephila clavipes]
MPIDQGFTLKVLEPENLASGVFRDGQPESDIRSEKLSYTRAFGDGPCNFEPWSSDVEPWSSDVDDT